MTLVFKLMISLARLFYDYESVSQSPLPRREISFQMNTCRMNTRLHTVRISEFCIYSYVYLIKIFYKYKG